MLETPTYEKLDNTHEWCRKGVDSQIRNLKGLSFDDHPWWIKKLNNFNPERIGLRLSPVPSGKRPLRI